MRKIYIFIAIVALFGSALMAGPADALAQYYGGTYYGSTGYGSGYSSSYGTYSGVPFVQAYPGYPTGYPTGYPPVGSCLNLTSNLYKGLSDVTTGGQVSMLQSFLIARGYLAIVAPTGYFGPTTANAVARYQVANGIPSDGTVGVLTRGSINSMSCGNTGGYTGGYYGAPVINSLSKTYGKAGDSITIYGTGFDRTNNKVSFNGVATAGIPSYNGTSLVFNVPQFYGNYNYNYNYNNLTTGTYAVYVTNARGTSNSVSFTVTSDNCYYNNYYNNCYNYERVQITDIDGPSTLRVDREGTWKVDLDNTDRNNVTVRVRWGDEGNYHYDSYDTSRSTSNRDATLTFRHTYQNSGTYTVVFTATDDRGGQSSLSTTVRVTGSGSSYNDDIDLDSVSPTSGRVGRQVTLYGSGFTSNNTVHFGNGGRMNLPSSNNGTRIYFTIPEYLSPCDVNPGTYCALYVQPVNPGTYPIYVTNSRGTSDTVNFRVTY